jgi:hypothetical protein
MQFRAAIEQDARALHELADLASRASGHADLLPRLTFEGDDYIEHERTLEAAAMTLRRNWLRIAHQSPDTTLKSPREGAAANLPSGRTMSFGYEREIDATPLERRAPAYLDRVPGWQSDLVLVRSGQSALACLLQFAVSRWGRYGALTVTHAGAYFETVSLLKAWPGRVLRFNAADQPADIVIAEPVWCDGAFSYADALPAAGRILMLDTTLAGPGYDLRPHLRRAECPLVIAYSSGLKLDQAGLELANVGIVRLHARRGVDEVGATLRYIRGLIGAGLTFDEMSALSAPWFMDRAYADRYVGAIFDHNRALAAAVGARSPLFAPHCHPSLRNQGADAPFCALQLNEPSPEAYRALVVRIAGECERRGLLLASGGSFGFRGHRFELIEPEAGQGETFLRIALGWRDGWSFRGLCELFGELAQGR